MLVDLMALHLIEWDHSNIITKIDLRSSFLTFQRLPRLKMFLFCSYLKFVLSTSLAACPLSNRIFAALEPW